jgi:hypothetical protein
MKKLKVTWIATAVAVGVLALAGVAAAATNTASPAATTAGDHCAAVTGNPEALAELQDLRSDFRDARQAWFDKYGAERAGDEAQAALEKLRDDYHAKVQSVFDKYGIEATAGEHAGGGYGHGGMMGTGYGNGMMGAGDGTCALDEAN